MKRINITIDDETANLLEGKINKSQLIREALRVYNGDVSTDTLAGMRQAFRKTQSDMAEVQQRMALLADLLTQIASKLLVQYNPAEFSDWGA